MYTRDMQEFLDESASFKNSGDAYIHSEMRNGKKPETILAGDILGMLWLVRAELARISQLTGTSFEDTVAAMVTMDHLGGYKGVKRALDKHAPELPLKRIEGNNPFAENDRLKIELASQKAAVKEAEKEAISARNIATQVKKDCEAKLKVKDQKIIELTKECDKLNKECDALTKMIQRGVSE